MVTYIFQSANNLVVHTAVVHTVSVAFKEACTLTYSSVVVECTFAPVKVFVVAVCGKNILLVGVFSQP